MSTDTEKIIEKITPIDITDKSNLDLSSISNKLDALVAMIPKNLCEDFPNLCKLGGRLDTLESSIGGLKEAIPKEIKVHIPKQTLPDPIAPIVNIDTEKLSKDVLANITPGLTFDLTPLNKVIGDGLQSIKDIMVETKNSSGANIAKKVETVISGDKNLKELLHTTPDDYFNCPECRAKLLTSLTKRIKTNKDKDIVDFLNNIKDTITLMNEGITNDTRSDTTTTTTGTRGVQESAAESKDEQPGKPGEVHESTDTTKEITETEQPDNTTDTVTECTSGWCLLRK